MSNLQYQKCYLEAIKLIISHDLKDDLILNYGSFLKQLSKNLNGQLVNNNIPNGTPPEIGRIVISNKELNFIFSLNRVEINIGGSRKHGGASNLGNAYQQKVGECIDILESYFRLDNFKEEFVGALGQVKYPQDLTISKDEIMKELSQAYGKEFKRKNKIVSFSSKIGFLSESNSEFINFEISNYEVKNIQITAAHQGQVINLDLFPTVEHGVQFIVDVNNRPRPAQGDLKTSLEDVLVQFFKAIEHSDLYL